VNNCEHRVQIRTGQGTVVSAAGPDHHSGRNSLCVVRTTLAGRPRSIRAPRRSFSQRHAASRAGTCRAGFCPSSDRYGHQAGDNLWAGVAEVAGRSCCSDRLEADEEDLVAIALEAAAAVGDAVASFVVEAGLAATSGSYVAGLGVVAGPVVAGVATLSLLSQPWLPAASVVCSEEAARYMVVVDLAEEASIAEAGGWAGWEESHRHGDVVDDGLRENDVSFCAVFRAPSLLPCRCGVLSTSSPRQQSPDRRG
jgi:hypothetical protein